MDKGYDKLGMFVFYVNQPILFKQILQSKRLQLALHMAKMGKIWNGCVGLENRRDDKINFMWNGDGWNSLTIKIKESRYHSACVVCM